jgi:hypothetical protein
MGKYHGRNLEKHSTMIIDTEEILDALEEHYPEITRESLVAICNKGLTYLRSTLAVAGEVSLSGRNSEMVKFYRPMSETLQKRIAWSRYHKKKKRDAKNSNK